MNKYIHIILCSFLLVACGTEDIPMPTDKTGIEVNATMNKQNTRSNFDGNAFENGDSFILFEGAPASGVKSSSYSYNGTSWSGTPGLYWDDLSIWDTDGAIELTPVNFTAVLTNTGEAFDPTVTSWPIVVAPTTKAEFLKSDLLVAYDSRTPLTPLQLKFHHVFARLRIELTDKTTGEGNPVILGDKTKLTLNALTGNTIAFSPASSETTVAATGTEEEVTLYRTDDSSTRTYAYEIILPAQTLREATSILTISGNANEKVYTYPLSNASIAGATTDHLLQQGKTTTISLSIAKTGLEIKTVTIQQWVEKAANGTATPDDYPIFEIGGDGDVENPPTPDDKDDYAGKTIKLTEDITLEELEKKLNIPLGSKEVPFRGTFDGQGYTITGVNMEEDKDFLGIFGYTDGATIKDLNVTGTGIKNLSKNSSTATGGLAGYVNNTIIVNCHTSYTGGVEAAYDNAGGLVGYVNGHSRIENCSSNTAVIAGHDYAGGLVGIAKKGADIKNSFSEGRYTVEAKNYYAGGLVGASYDVNIEYSYSWSDAKAIRYAGGLIGRYESATGANLLTHCYAAGQTVSGGSNQAGMVAYIEIRPGKPNKCYWNSDLGAGFIGLFTGGENSSFTLTSTLAAMNNVLNALNDDAADGPWQLTRTNYNKYVLPTLISNEGKAKPKTGE